MRSFFDCITYDVISKYLLLLFKDAKLPLKRYEQSTGHRSCKQQTRKRSLPLWNEVFRKKKNQVLVVTLHGTHVLMFKILYL